MFGRETPVFLIRERVFLIHKATHLKTVKAWPLCFLLTSWIYIGLITIVSALLCWVPRYLRSGGHTSLELIGVAMSLKFSAPGSCQTS